MNHCTKGKINLIKLVIALLICSNILGCKSYISDEKMQLILQDIYLAEANIEQADKMLNKYKLDIYTPIFEKHNCTIEEFQQKMDQILQDNSKKRTTVFNNVLQYFQMEESHIIEKENYLRKQDSLANAYSKKILYSIDTLIEFKKVTQLKNFKLSIETDSIGNFDVDMFYTLKASGESLKSLIVTAEMELIDSNGNRTKTKTRDHHIKKADSLTKASLHFLTGDSLIDNINLRISIPENTDIDTFLFMVDSIAITYTPTIEKCREIYDKRDKVKDSLFQDSLRRQIKIKDSLKKLTEFKDSLKKDSLKKDCEIKDTKIRNNENKSN